MGQLGPERVVFQPAVLIQGGLEVVAQARLRERRQLGRQLLCRLAGGTGGDDTVGEADVFGFGRDPNSAVPTRTMVAPSCIATSRSADMPIDNFGKRYCSARRARLLK